MLLMCGVAVAGSFWVASRWAVGKPEPATSSRQAILRYLATADATAEPLEFQQALIERLEQELRGGMPVDGAASAGESYQARLRANAAALKEVWFRWRTEQYAKLPADQKAAFLDERIETVLAWARLDAALNRNRTSASSEGGSPAAGFFDEIAGWMRAESQTQRRQQMEQAVQDGLVRWLATRKLDDQSPEVRRELAMRIAAKLDDGLSLTSTLAQQPAGEQDVLRSNARLLVEAWLLAQADLYFQLEESKRVEFIDARMNEVQRWGVLELLSAQQGEGALPASGLVGFLTVANEWIAHAPPEKQSQLRELLIAVQARMFVKWLQSR
jgi:hypothetical protein